MVIDAFQMKLDGPVGVVGVDAYLQQVEEKGPRQVAVVELSQQVHQTFQPPLLS